MIAFVDEPPGWFQPLCAVIVLDKSPFVVTATTMICFHSVRKGRKVFVVAIWIAHLRVGYRSEEFLTANGCHAAVHFNFTETSSNEWIKLVFYAFNFFTKPVERS